MTLRKRLDALVDAVAAEADRNPGFRSRLEVALGLEALAVAEGSGGEAETRRKGGRRTAAVLDPIELARKGEEELRGRLAVLDLEQLRDIVAQYGMDPGKLVMKWKDSIRVVDRIVEMAIARAKKGDAFRAD